MRPRIPRWAHRAYAWAFGYFWLPCPLCREMFGGHEWKDRDGNSGTVQWGGRHRGKGICPTCTRMALGNRPSVPVVLDPGSFEVSPEVERRYGREVLDAMNGPSVPCDPNAMHADDPWDPDDLPSTADPGVVTDPKEEP